VTTVLLVRHATTAATGKRLGGWTDASLDERGVAQAEATAERLAGAPLVAVYSSPIVRTRETARIVAKPHGLRVRTRKGLGEVDYGDWTDRTLASLRKLVYWKVIQTTPSRVSFPGGGTIRGVQATAVDTIEALAADHPDDTIAVVSHADVLKAVVAHYLGMPLDTFQRIHIAPASVSVLHLPADGMPVLARLNDTGPLRWSGPEKTAP
jgi:probable phosphomutase (TIGR03848 family)